LDILCILIALPALLPLMLLIAGYIKLVSRGPVFFKQERIGYREHPFLCLKFRSMKVNAASQIHQDYLKELMSSERPMVKMDLSGDSRLIPGGAVLRATGLDELPQLINVWVGDMSIVGPRPCTRYEFEQYQARHKGRFSTLPGLTGLWQVSGKNRTTFAEMIDLDVRYAENASLGMDLRIMAKTVRVLIAQVYETCILPGLRDRESGTPRAPHIPH
jgi:lipopolysaccharide/colanic/teichoic acid biosynthesis glycosyltransferase